MSRTEWAQGDAGTYEGLMAGRFGQHVTCITVWTDGDLSVRFADGFAVRCSRRRVTRHTAPKGDF